MTKTLRTIDQLAEAGLLVATEDLAKVADAYAIAVSPHLAAMIDPNDPADPIAKQFVPNAAELLSTSRETEDPIGDAVHSPVRGIVHRYPDRVLLKAVAVCPVYCRFCFRREMVGPGKESNLTAEELSGAIDYIRQDSNIWEVILTGGDPFMLSPARAKAITDALEDIPHVKVIRWHTRMPVAAPDRVTTEYADALRTPTKATYVAIHINHARELSGDVMAACGRLTDAGIPLLSQSVLLRGVNDNVEDLSDLMKGLVAARVKPYYLHQLDYAPGTSHFRVPLDEAQSLVQQLRDNVSGLCQPQFVIDIPGGVSKALASPSDVSADGAQVRGRDGVWRDY